MPLTHLTQKWEEGAAPPDGFPVAPLAATVVLSAHSHSGPLVLEEEALQRLAKPD